MVSPKRIAVIVLAVLVVAIGAVAFAAERSSKSAPIQRSAPASPPPAPATVNLKSLQAVSKPVNLPGQMSGEITSSISGKTIHDIFGTAKNIVLDLLDENGVKVGTVTVEDSPDGKSGRYKISHDKPRHFRVQGPGTWLTNQLQWQYYEQWTTGDDSHNITNIVLKSIKPVTSTSAGSDFMFKNVRFEPLTYRAGEKIVIRADLYNFGTQKAYSGVGTHVKNWLYNKDQQIYGTDEQVLDLAPGKSQTMAYVWNSVVCGAPISLVFDPDRVLGETNKSTVWYGTTVCAPAHGPDLTVTQIKFKGLSYGGKNPGVSNEVSYSIKNIGDADSVPVKAMASAGSQKLTIISVPFLHPGGYYSDVFNYTPSNCDPVHINIDTQGVMGTAETNRDNNDIYEDSKVTQWCKNLPQLQFDRVYWKVNGYSFGKSSYPNGSSMDFEVDVGNLSWDATVGCATVVKIRVEVNGQFSTDIMVGNVGNCANGGWHNVSDSAHMAKTVKFKIGPACNADIKLTIDPDHINPELDRTNNTWSTNVQCE
jgi:hypothetical protein